VSIHRLNLQGQSPRAQLPYRCRTPLIEPMVPGAYMNNDLQATVNTLVLPRRPLLLPLVLVI
jgi:hypothetical protein